ncbi:hypothetical protein BE17_11650 [Sorangium cellulosum]|uniref:Uncharacterized protein n=1 Tax=Sorangium cellulosum TaxID=56 RepID=A0A150QWU3_SORCE|nr:hypothetical protein BE17_11650 [Sorangium cellulosum]
MLPACASASTTGAAERGRAELAPPLLVAGTAPVLGPRGEDATLAPELLVASVAPALDQV